MLLFKGSMFFLFSTNSNILTVRKSMLSNSIKEGRGFRRLLRKEEKNMEMDVCWKEYFQDDARYADVINGIGCGGQRLKQVFDFIRCSGDRKALAELVQNDKAYQAMEEDAYDVVTQYVKANRLVRIKDEYKGKDGKVNMCQALEELIEEGREEGRASGLADGREQGHADAIRNVVIRMVKKGKSDEEIMELTECSATLIWEVRRSMK